MAKVTDRIIRNYALSKGHLDVRIKRTGEVLVWGVIRSERRCGWHLFGYLGDLAARIEIELLEEKGSLSVEERARVIACVSAHILDVKSSECGR